MSSTAQRRYLQQTTPGKLRAPAPPSPHHHLIPDEQNEWAAFSRQTSNETNLPPYRDLRAGAEVNPPTRTIVPAGTRHPETGLTSGCSAPPTLLQPSNKRIFHKFSARPYDHSDF
ncbi:hypothetical protein Bbelb_206500 [Branchiostoma belcheri]|nr:hypothetical protein Bbelb_206500 [Branchiostoma belcheri]